MHRWFNLNPLDPRAGRFTKPLAPEFQAAADGLARAQAQLDAHMAQRRLDAAKVEERDRALDAIVREATNAPPQAAGCASRQEPRVEGGECFCHICFIQTVMRSKHTSAQYVLVTQGMQRSGALVSLLHIPQLDRIELIFTSHRTALRKCRVCLP